MSRRDGARPREREKRPPPTRRSERFAPHRVFQVCLTELYLAVFMRDERDRGRDNRGKDRSREYDRGKDRDNRDNHIFFGMSRQSNQS